MQCPKCEGAMWDNRDRKTNPKAPDYKCKDSNCDGVIWPPRGTSLQAPKQDQIRREKTGQDTDWDAIARGKVRHGVVVAVIEHDGLGPALGSLPSIERLVEYIMSGPQDANPTQQQTEDF